VGLVQACDLVGGERPGAVAVQQEEDLGCLLELLMASAAEDKSAAATTGPWLAGRKA